MNRLARALAVLAAAFLVLAGLTPGAEAAARAPVAPVQAEPTRSSTQSPSAAKGPRGPKKFTTLRGTYQRLTTDVADDPKTVNPYFPPDISRTHDVVRDVLVVDGRWVDLKFPPGKRAKPGQQLTLSGYTDGASMDVTTMAATSSFVTVDTTDITKTLVILAHWGPKDSVTKSKAADVIFTQGNVWWKEVSYGLTSLTGTVVDWVSIPGPTGGDCYGRGEQILSQAVDAAESQRGLTGASTYERTIVYFPFCAAASQASGWAYAPGRHVWLNGYMDKRVSIHEQGHNYGLLHAHSLTCSTGALSGSCQGGEYGDDYDAMGGSGLVGHFNIQEKARLSWVSGKVHTFASGELPYTIAPLESSSGMKGGIATGPSRKYWIEYRSPIGQDKNFPVGGRGLLIHTTGSPGIADGGTNLLDVNPIGADTWEGAAVSLAKGGSWTSPDKVRIAFVSSTTSGAQVKVTYGAPLPVAPSAPTSATAKAGDTTALVSWGIPSNDGNDALVGYRVYYQKSGSSAQSVDVNSAGGLVHSAKLTGLTNNVSYAVWVKARNGSYWSPESNHTSVTPRPLVPTVTVTNPVAGTTVNADVVTLTANAVKNATSNFAISSVDFYVDGQYYSSDWTAPYAVNWEASYEKDGTHTVQAWATDANNRVGKSSVISFTLKKPIPTVTITSAVVKDASTMTLHLKASAGSSSTTVDVIYVTYDDGQFVGSIYRPTSLLDMPLDWDTKLVSAGTHKLKAEIINSQGRQGFSPIFISPAVAHPIPLPNAATPTEGTTYYEDFTVSGVASRGLVDGLPGGEIAYVDATLDSTYVLAGDYDIPTSDQANPGSWSFDISAAGLDEGVHTFTIRATDVDGFVGSETRTFTIARPTPTVTISSPLEGDTVHGQTAQGGVDVVTVPTPSTHSGTAIQWVEVVTDDGVSLGSRWEPDPGIPEGSPPPGTWTVSAMVGSLSAGAHTLLAKAHDVNGFTGTSDPLHVIVDVPAPSVSLVADPPDDSQGRYTQPFSVTATPQQNQSTHSPIAGVEFRLRHDGHPDVQVEGTPSGSDYTIQIDPALYDPVDYQLVAIARDENGYKGESAPASLTFLTPGPGATISTPGPDATVVIDPGPLHVEANVVPAVGLDLTSIEEVDLLMDGSPIDSKFAPDAQVSQAVFDVSYVSPGLHSLTVQVRDASRTRHSDSVPIKAVGLPQAPYGYGSGGDGKITLIWQRPDLAFGTLSKYTLQEVDPLDGTTPVGSPILISDSSSLAAQEVTKEIVVPAGQERLYTVTATTEAGTSPPSYPMSALAYDYTAPDAVTGLKLVSVGATTANIAWTKSTSADVDYQDVYADAGATANLWSTPKTVTGSTTSTGLTGLTTTGDYAISVVPRDPSYNIGSAATIRVKATTLALSRSVTSLTYGSSVTLKATLKTATSKSLVKSASVTFYYRPKGSGSYKSLGSKSTGTTGIATLVTKPLRNVEYYAKFGGGVVSGSNYFPRSSAVGAVLVKPKIASRITNLSGTTITSVRYGNYVYIKATVSPNHKGQKVYVQRLSGTTWKSIATVTLSTYSTITYKYKSPKGTFKYRIYKPSDADHYATYSPTMTLKAY